MREIPYEKQMTANGQRTCGAAALQMIYKSFGIDLPQLAIWNAIALPDGQGGRFANTYRITLDVILRGMHAVAFRAKDPILAVEKILENNIDVIMNHRVSENVGFGHYTVAIDIGQTTIKFHDPQFGKKLTRSLNEMRSLWTPKHIPSEISGNVLIAISQNVSGHTCHVCGQSSRENIICPTCKISLSLQPVAALGCTRTGCDAKLWEFIVCPYCDHVIDNLIS